MFGDGTFMLAMIMLIFYLYLLARFDRVKRPAFFLIGALGIATAFAARFFAVGGNPGAGIFVVVRVLDSIGGAAAFLMAVAACFGGKLPGKFDGLEKKAEDATK